MKRVAALAIFLVALRAEPQQSYAPTPEGTAGLFSLAAAETLPARTFSVAVYVNNRDREAVRSLHTQFRTWEYDVTTTSVAVAYGITDTVEVSTVVPYVSYDDDSNRRSGIIEGEFVRGPLHDRGLAPVQVALKWRLFTDRTFRRSIAVDGRVEASLDNNIATADTAGYRFRIAATLPNWVFNATYRHPGQKRLARPDEIIAGVGYVASISHRLDIIAELESVAFVRTGARPPRHVDLTGGARYWLADGRWAVSVGLRANIASAEKDLRDPCPFGAVIGVTYYPSFFDVE